ncbi:MAG: TIGR00300 family protein [Cenarchaeum sp. SB0665_bin_23]|nr:TIGR00300 family protein [Cenarchaeum sp. SB0667_bin_13]MXY60752.1 TIGR00300 family protein [Cenarchaeum sp. SB0665_bin_23]MXZ93682.1 TIGR00300 family protein [Cenarchaeum sp. SB0666_bin_15]MYB47264.1 TIGR00300 family protein [Cenarchaeum sp. SB0662_bin_33]MYC79331.1 TIGR00300 family protein [Cenarchaeum sp. SB0661_bin_35]MYD58265.1 TIGR00300 family protein [Cenarchaeum sp. SB0678_bin_8]MYG32675.1 TIGR00300 family protein [Cenarchaeum sp. SB0677_bin_16]MYI51597.1 TIGR00300 family protein 
MSTETKTVEMRGHIIDSMALARVMNKIIGRGGSYEFLQFDVGVKDTDISYLKLQVTADNTTLLDEILDDIHREGAIDIDPKSATIKPAPKDMTLPMDFYSTTNNETRIFYDNHWILVQKQMMDKCIVLRDDNTAVCTPIRDVHQGDEIVCGEDGVHVIVPRRPRKTTDTFAFMNSGSSSERPTLNIARRVAQDIYNAKKNNGRVIIVGGPAIVHTGGSPSISAMIRHGYINGILAGNALAVHDIESSIYGTSLGMRIKDATPVSKGHRNHMDTVNEVFTYGSIRQMVDAGRLQKGIFYECVKNNIPFVLAGSIRDDGPLPDVITDVVQAQRKYKELLKGATLVLMISTMLHSIAVGNMLPSTVQIIAVDINQSTVTKLVDRGTWHALGIVTDVGAFLPLVLQEIQQQEST